MSKLFICILLFGTSLCFEQILSEKRSKGDTTSDILFLDNEAKDISKRDVYSNQKRRRKPKNLNNPGNSYFTHNWEMTPSIKSSPRH